jgi:hypothetical protein
MSHGGPAEDESPQRWRLGDDPPGAAANQPGVDRPAPLRVSPASRQIRPAPSPFRPQI